MKSAFALALVVFSSGSVLAQHGGLTVGAQPGGLELLNGQTLRQGEYAVAISTDVYNDRAPQVSRSSPTSFRRTTTTLAASYGLTGRTDVFFRLPYERAYTTDAEWSGYLGDRAESGRFDLSGFGKLRAGVRHRLFGGPHDLVTASISAYQDINFGSNETERLTGDNSRGVAFNLAACKWLVTAGYRDSGGDPSTNELEVGAGWSGVFRSVVPIAELTYVHSFSSRYDVPARLKVAAGIRVPLRSRVVLTAGITARLDELHTGRSPFGVIASVGRRSRP